MTIIAPDLRSCEQCGKPFEPRSGSGGSVQRFCNANCRLNFHMERLRSQRTGAYAGKRQQPATLQPAPSPTLFEQAERLIAKLTLDERRRLIGWLLASVPPEKVEKAPELPPGRRQLAGKSNPKPAPQGAPPIKSKAPVSAKDIALENFDAHVLELLRLIRGQKPQRFAKSAVPKPLLGDLAHFLREVVAARKIEDDPVALADAEVAS
jgi:hypothetical protein